MKCELAAALIHRPARCSSSTSPPSASTSRCRSTIRDFIKALQRAHGATLILTSHYMDDVAALCPRVIVIDKGALSLRRRAGRRWCSRVRPEKRVVLRLVGAGGRAQRSRRWARWCRTTPADGGAPGAAGRGERAIVGRALATLPVHGPHRGEPAARGGDERAVRQQPRAPAARWRRGVSLRSTVRALPTLLRVGFAEAVAYRAEMLVWVLATTMPLIMLALWTAVARDAPVGPLRAAGLRRLLPRDLHRAPAHRRVGGLADELRGAQGTLAMRLLRPDAPAVVLRGGEPRRDAACALVVALPVAVHRARRWSARAGCRATRCCWVVCARSRCSAAG